MFCRIVVEVLHIFFGHGKISRICLYCTLAEDITYPLPYHCCMYMKPQGTYSPIRAHPLHIAGEAVHSGRGQGSRHRPGGVHSGEAERVGYCSCPQTGRGGARQEDTICSEVRHVSRYLPGSGCTYQVLLNVMSSGLRPLI